MCFSATVSFGAAAVLIPLGLHTLQQAWRSDHRFLALATFPLLFGLQQCSEGLTWLNLGGLRPEYTQTSALGFLFFVYLLWPVLVPLAARQLDDRPRPRAALLLLALFSASMGALVYLPLLLNPDGLTVTIVQHSILYEPRLLFGEPWNAWISRTGYALAVTLPLLISPWANVRLFGALVALSLILSALYFDHAFTSVWCFFAALLSIFIRRLIRLDAPHPQAGVISAQITATEASRP